MGYYVRVLSTSAECVPLSELHATLEEENLRASISADDDSVESWDQIILIHADGREISSIERNLVEDGSLGEGELAEFAEAVANCQPANAAKWLIDYFRRVRCIYAFQVLSGADYQNGWDILDAIKRCIWSFAPSILQADDEGFTNEDGYHILWQFNDSVKGDWWMAVLQDGQWKKFQMELGNRKQREAFFRGQVPDDARLG
jgi:hypothetical protein